MALNELTEQIIGSAIEVRRGAWLTSFQNDLCGLRVLRGERVDVAGGAADPETTERGCLRRDG